MEREIEYVWWDNVKKFIIEATIIMDIWNESTCENEFQWCKEN